jgi:hypothetical protein
MCVPFSTFTFLFSVALCYSLCTGVGVHAHWMSASLSCKLITNILIPKFY